MCDGDRKMVKMVDGQPATPEDAVEAADKPGMLEGINKGDLSNSIAFGFLVLGVITVAVDSNNVFFAYLLSFGLFSFCGGITNWLAVKMLFDRIPFLYGSGVIPRQFVAIRETVKNTIMKTFFDSEYLETYINDRAKGLLGDLDLGARIKSGLEKPEFDTKLIAKLEEMSLKPEGMLIQTMAQMFGGVPLLVPVIKPLILGFADEFASSFVDNFDIKELVSVDKIRNELDKLMSEKLLLLTPELVKALMEEVIREHLSWLIIWGNLFGGILGILSQAAGFGT
ncbi:hypothetical protein TrCOL_g3854 [Triparma columacea]|uniref:DUF445 domain-containing protein n=1 Tax=Triparma columacea TaxID=722753 RepID=A0A9W7GCB7_9STRA|nr:hypothetical protein TrCOL_g3854 [Triparma columacea]